VTVPTGATARQTAWITACGSEDINTRWNDELKRCEYRAFHCPKDPTQSTLGKEPDGWKQDDDVSATRTNCSAPDFDVLPYAVTIPTIGEIPEHKKGYAGGFIEGNGIAVAAPEDCRKKAETLGHIGWGHRNSNNTCWSYATQIGTEGNRGINDEDNVHIFGCTDRSFRVEDGCQKIVIADATATTE